MTATKIESPMAERRMEIPNAILLGQVKDAIRAGESVTINVKGYSMRPFLEHCRDKVLLVAPAVLQVGDAVLAEIAKDVYVLHRIVAIRGGHVTLMGDGNLRGVEHCRAADVVAKVACYYRKGKAIEADDAFLVRCVRLWRRSLPLRRYLLYIYKVKLKLTKILQ